MADFEMDGFTVELSHMMDADADVMGGPDSEKYAVIGTVSAGDNVECIESEGNMFLIAYVDSGMLRRGYVAKESLLNYASINAAERELSGHMDYVGDVDSVVYAGPDSELYLSIAEISAGDSVFVVGDGTNNYSFVEVYTAEGLERGYVETAALQGTANGVIGKYTGSGNLTVYAGPHGDRFQMVGSVASGEAFLVMDTLLSKDSSEDSNAEWYYIDYSTATKRKRGYIIADDVTLVPAFSTEVPGPERIGVGVYEVINGGTLQYGPDSKYASVKKDETNKDSELFFLKAGTRVSVFEGYSREEKYANVEASVNAQKSKFLRAYFPLENLKKVNLSILEPELSEADLAAYKKSYGTSPKYHDLVYYKIGYGSKALVAVFAIHGYEDAWAADGLELVTIAHKVVESMVDARELPWSSEWTLYVIPAANPDGILNGYTHCGPGRANVQDGIDMNRCFDAGFSRKYDRRNYTGATPCIPVEAAALKNLLEQINDNHSSMSLLDVHGWYNCYYGDGELGDYFVDRLGIRYDGGLSGGFWRSMQRLILVLRRH